MSECRHCNKNHRFSHLAQRIHIHICGFWKVPQILYIFLLLATTRYRNDHERLYMYVLHMSRVGLLASLMLQPILGHLSQAKCE